MKKRFIPQSGSFSLRLALCAAAVCSIITGTLLAFSRLDAPIKVPQRSLTFTDRVTYQRIIEDVYWRHRIWPRGGGKRFDPKPPLDAVMSQGQIEQKVADYLRNSQSLERWHQQVTTEQLQAEMDRMAQHTRKPEMLRELFEALGNDPFVIAECLARPVLSDRLVTTLAVHDQGFHSDLNWSARSGSAGLDYQICNRITRAGAGYTLPTISNGAACSDDTWTPSSSTNAPSGRPGHTAVWTGSEMIIWGGYNLRQTGSATNVNGGTLNTGGRYDPSTDSWTATSTINAPDARGSHTAVWTGSEMIVWGGFGGTNLNTGGRYNPATDSWTLTSTTNAPAGRQEHTAVWNGNEMIVWGGFDGTNLNTGGRYNPGTDSWIPTSVTNTPSGRSDHTAIWTGTEMIVWGGFIGGIALADGGRYDPNTDSWTGISTDHVPSVRAYHTAVWTGSEMIVWGGWNDQDFLNTGGSYDPKTDAWTATNTTNAPDARFVHTAVWTGREMIVWGGWDGVNYFNTGGRYDPNTDSWTATNTADAPSGRSSHTAVWTGNEMVVWGGDNPTQLNTGGRYCAAVPNPTATPTITPTATPRDVPTPRPRPTPHPRP